MIYVTVFAGCADKLTNCADYGTSVCSDSNYAQWVTENCAAFCNKCGSGTGKYLLFFITLPYFLISDKSDNFDQIF